MTIETEFQRCLQRQRLEWAFRRSPDGWTSCDATLDAEISPSTWVEMLHTPSPFSFDEALLLTPCAHNQWVAWVPDYGEIVLERSQFRLPSP